MNYRIAGRIRARTALPREYDYETRRLTRIPRDIRLRDGKLRLQELRPVNREQLKTFFSRCSPRRFTTDFRQAIRLPIRCWTISPTATGRGTLGWE